MFFAGLRSTFFKCGSEFRLRDFFQVVGLSHDLDYGCTYHPLHSQLQTLGHSLFEFSRSDEGVTWPSPNLQFAVKLALKVRNLVRLQPGGIANDDDDQRLDFCIVVRGQIFGDNDHPLWRPKTLWWRPTTIDRCKAKLTLFQVVPLS
jgi:hypothetical protein